MVSTSERGQRVLTPDQRLRVFVSSAMQELAPERAAVRAAIEALQLTPVLFELGARPHPPRTLYQAYLEQSQIFIGIIRSAHDLDRSLRSVEQRRWKHLLDAEADNIRAVLAWLAERGAPQLMVLLRSLYVVSPQRTARRMAALVATRTGAARHSGPR